MDFNTPLILAIHCLIAKQCRNVILVNTKRKVFFKSMQHFFAFTVRNFCIRLPLHAMEEFSVTYIKFKNTLILKNTNFYLNFNTYVYIF